MDFGHVVNGVMVNAALPWMFEKLGYYPNGMNDPVPDPWNYGTLENFDMTEFLPSGWSFDDSTFRETGMVYIPNECTEESGSADGV